MHLLKRILLGGVLMSLLAIMLQSCGGGVRNTIIPRSVSTVGVTTVKDLRLKEGEYDILRSVTETASVVCEYNGGDLRINSGDGDFSYRFVFDSNVGWVLVSFSGAATMGYFSVDPSHENTQIPSPEEFARRVAMAKIINAVVDYNADGVIEPVTSTRVAELGKNKVEYTSTVRAKLINVKTTK